MGENKSKHPSNTPVHLEVENEIVNYLEKKVGDNYKKEEIKGVKIKLDFYNEEKKIIAEVFAVIDHIKPGQKNKFKSDFFKLLYAEKLIGPPCDKRIYVIQKEIEQTLKRDSWFKNAIEAFEIAVCLYDLKEKNPNLMEKLKIERLGNQSGYVMKKVK